MTRHKNLKLKGIKALRNYVKWRKGKKFLFNQSCMFSDARLKLTVFRALAKHQLESVKRRQELSSIRRVYLKVRDHSSH